jgi:hypothetical protein
VGTGLLDLVRQGLRYQEMGRHVAELGTSRDGCLLDGVAALVCGCKSILHQCGGVVISGFSLSCADKNKAKQWWENSRNKILSVQILQSCFLPGGNKPLPMDSPASVQGAPCVSALRLRGRVYTG